MADLNWQGFTVQAALSFVSGAVGWGLAIWRGGYNSAKKEQAVKDDYTGRISNLREEVRTAMTAFAKDTDNKSDALIDQFKESFDGMRRQMDDTRLHTEKNFLRKDDFRDFHKEYREDMRRIFDKLDSLPH